MPCLSLQQCDAMVKNNKQDVMRKMDAVNWVKGFLMISVRVVRQLVLMHTNRKWVGW